MSELKEMPLVQLSAKDVPAFCPNPNMPRWSTHPRVFLDISHGEARCPYCGSRYKLKDGETIKGHCARCSAQAGFTKRSGNPIRGSNLVAG